MLCGALDTGLCQTPFWRRARIRVGDGGGRVDGGGKNERKGGGCVTNGGVIAGKLAA